MWKEAVKTVHDALEASLPDKLAVLDIYEGDSVPEVKRFLNPFEDDDLDVPDWPRCITIPDEAQAPGEFEQFGKGDFGIPLLVRLETEDADSAGARSRLSYFCRGVMQVLNDLDGRAVNGARFIQFLGATWEIGTIEQDGKLVAEVRFIAQMREENV